MTSFCCCLLQQLAFSESRHFSWDKDPSRTMAYDTAAARGRGERWALPVSCPNDNRPGRRGRQGVGCRPPRARCWSCTAGIWLRCAHACWTAWRGTGSGPPQQESSGAGAATPLAVAGAVAAATMTPAACPPGRGETGLPCRGGGKWHRDTPSLYYNPPGQFLE